MGMWREATRFLWLVPVPELVAVLNAYVAMPDKITGVVLICPKINGPETVSKKTYAENPAFKESLERLQLNLNKMTSHDKSTQLLSYYSPADGTIPYAGSHIPGVPERRLPALRHGRAIVYALTFGAPSFIRFLRQLEAGPPGQTLNYVRFQAETFAFSKYAQL